MHILMIAPEPFFEPRGTPFSEFHRIRALIDLGHTVDLVTYPLGRNVTLPGLRVFRSARPPFVRRVRIGPSLVKLLLDLALAGTVLRRALSDRYDAVHSHEEGSAIGVIVAALLRAPHLYDMHSSLPQQLSNFNYTRSRLLTWGFSRLERAVIRRSQAVIVICPQLEETVRAIDPTAATVLIENAPGSGDAPRAGEGKAVRRRLGLGESTPTVLYTGTFEAYQGLPLLFASARVVVERLPTARFVLVGGDAGQVDRARADAHGAGVGQAVILTGERPPEEIPAFLDAADVLVSPRSTGTNTPLKIYQYLRAGKPIVATRLLTHTQVLSDEVAVLTGATPTEFAEGILAALTDGERSRHLGEAARHLAETKYSYEAYLERTRQAYAHLAGGLREQPQAGGGRSSDHYSYAVYADRGMAERFDALRFSGPIGTWLAETQEDVLTGSLGPVEGTTVLDVGTGTGRAALALARRGARVTGIDASCEMLSVASDRARQEGLTVALLEGDAHLLSFPDRSFDAAVSLRVLMHTPDWRRCLGELCRVARVRIVFDYPALASAAALQSVSRRLLSRAGRQVEAYRVIGARAVAAELARHGFRIVNVHKQFVLPIGFHKLIGSRRFSGGIEALLARVGLLRLLGSPVTVVAERARE